MAQKQEPGRRQAARHTGDDGSRRLRREIHENVAAEDDVEGAGLPERRVVCDEIAFLERHHVPDCAVEEILPALVERQSQPAKHRPAKAFDVEVGRKRAHAALSLNSNA